LGIGVSVYFYRSLIFSPSSSDVTTQSIVRPAPVPATGRVKDKIVTPFEETRPPPSSLKMPLGRVIIEDEIGRVISEIPAAIIDGSIVALPVKLCIGGREWICRTEKALYTIMEGHWQRDVPLGLWYLDRAVRDAGMKHMPLAPWMPDAPVEWIGLDRPGPSVPVSPEFIERDGFFDKCEIPRRVNQPGVFVQNDRVVGWSFGPLLEGAYMWDGPPGDGLFADTTVAAFYDQTFSGGREEQFFLAKAMPDDTPDQDRLAAYARGFLLKPKLPVDLTPLHLQVETVAEQMVRLARQLLREDSEYNVSRILDKTVLRAANSLDLLSVAVVGVSGSSGTRSAIHLLEELREDMIEDNPGQSNPPDKLDQLHLSLYKQLISEALHSGNTINSRQALRLAKQYFPDDPELHLMGVALMIRENDWAEAEELLMARSYPAALSDKRNTLKSRINELKSLEGKIAIRFNPGSSYIPVIGRLNGSHEQPFVVDTGATLTTIPSTAVEALGLTINDHTPRVRTSTAGALKSFYQLTLDAIEVQEQVVRNVKVLVVDIEGNPSLGLLGLNFLNNFEMEVNNEKGIMTLAPIY